MNNKKKNLIIAVSGASGALYADLLLQKLLLYKSQLNKVDVVISDNAKTIWKQELDKEFKTPETFRQYGVNDFNAPMASGSSNYDTMIVCPCSMGMLGRIASGISDDLISRAADVMLKERRKLILVPRETPINLIHIRNMQLLTESGAIICFATPSFYSKPVSIEQLCYTVVDRILELSGLDIETYRWNM